MILPSTYSAALLLTILSMICWGSWANTFKLSGKWRFELFYFDFAAGVLIAAVIAAFTFGSLGGELSFTDNLLIAGKTQMAWGFGAGVIFNLANMLLVAAISIAGMAVAFPVGIGLALVVGVVWNYFLNPQGNPTLLGAGVALVVGAIILDALAYALHARSKRLAETPETQSMTSPSRAKTQRNKRPARKTSIKGILLSLISGILMGSFYPMVEMGKASEIGLGPYAIAFIFAVGVFLSTFVFNVYFMNLPVEGEAVAFSEYVRGAFRQHALGICGGLIWCTGAISNFVAASAPKGILGPAVSYAIGQGATMISALWGLLVWREFAGAVSRVRMLLVSMFILFLAGLVLVSVAPLYER
ncbi:MAG: AcrB/AcrD/AcrF family protein [Bryobacteraceae bacterium]